MHYYVLITVQYLGGDAGLYACKLLVALGVPQLVHRHVENLRHRNITLGTVRLQSSAVQCTAKQGLFGALITKGMDMFEALKVMHVMKLLEHFLSASMCITLHVQCYNGPLTTVYSTVQYSTVQYSTVQYSTVQYSTVQ